MKNRDTSRKKCSPPALSRLGPRAFDASSSSSKAHGLEIVSSSRYEKIRSVFSSFDSQKTNLVNSIGFGGLLKLRSQDLDLNLCLSLYQRFDYKRSCLHLDQGVDMYFGDIDVHLVFGIPFEGAPVDWSVHQHKETLSAFTLKLFSAVSSSSLTISFLEDILTKQYDAHMSTHEKEAFIISSVLYACTYLLAPQVNHHFPIQLIKNFVPNVNPADLNWSQLVLKILDRASVHARLQYMNGFQQISIFGSCLFLQVLYLDNMNFGPSSPYHNILPTTSAAISVKHMFNSPIMKRTKSSVSILRKRIERCRVRRLQSVSSTQLGANKPIQVLARVEHASSSSKVVQSGVMPFRITSVHGVHQSSALISQACAFKKRVVTSHSNFPDKFRDNMFAHPDVSSEDKYKCYLWMTNGHLSKDQLEREWIAFRTPNALSIRGHEVHDCLRLNGCFTVSIVDAIIFIWSYLDIKMQKYFSEREDPHNIWRHFLPPSFAEIVFSSAPFLNSDAIRAIFLGDHISYHIEDCQQIILPVHGYGETWSCYFWDFKFKTITVLDPVLMNCPVAVARETHSDSLFKLHDALFACIDHFFYGWDVPKHGWTDVYVTNVGHNCSPVNSGLYAVHYARSFCGKKDLAFKMKEDYESICDARGEILYHLLTCSYNRGYKSELLMQKIGFYDL